jgi:hypothetical protein
MFLVASKWTSTSHPPTPANNAQMHPRNRLGYGRLEQQCAGGSIGRVRLDVGAHCGHSGFALLSKAEGRVAGQLGRTRELFDWHGVRTLGGFDEADSDIDAISGMFRGTPTYACTAQSEPYATTGVLSWGTAFSALWLPPSTTMDWTQGVDRVAVILKDTENNKPSADNVGDAEAARYTPTRVRMVVTVVTQAARTCRLVHTTRAPLQRTREPMRAATRALLQRTREAMRAATRGRTRRPDWIRTLRRMRRTRPGCRIRRTAARIRARQQTLV